MSDVKPLIRELAQYAFAKKGAEQASNVIVPDVLDYPFVELPVQWGGFFEVDHERDHSFARMPVLARRLQDHQTRHPAIRKSNWMERDGHLQMEVPLDAGLSVDLLKQFIDEAHDIVWNKLDSSARLLIELGDLPYDEPKLIERLTEIHDLSERRDSLRRVARPAILLRTRKSSEAKIPLGATKIGGRPDLPADLAWPTYRDGKPLAFLAQLDLAEIARSGSPVAGLPTDGLLSLFSVWGWTTEADSDPQTPDETSKKPQEADGWTVLFHVSHGSKLERRKTPRGVNSFKGAAVEPTPILSLPGHRQEPALAELDLTEDELERFDELQSDFRSLQLRHWVNSFSSFHQLGGFALFQQEYPEEVLGQERGRGLEMLLQIGTDAKTEMCWGDGGELTFYADIHTFREGRLDRLWGTCQGG